jgi:nucleoside-diphosphate-sugar epimerase/ubiquinone/menaquinone biosynthesis C-methylase UbiE
MKTILLTGANGYVGKYVLEELLKRGYNVTAFIKRGTSISHLENKNIRLIKGDLLDKESLNEALDGIDAVIHLAAAVRIKSPKINYDINVIGSKNLIDVCIQKNVKRVIFTSSVSVLRSRRGPYGETKYKAEKQFEKSNLDYTIFRPTLIYGVESQGIKNIVDYIQKFPFFIPLIGKGKYTRQPVSVYDVARVLVDCLDKKETFRNIYPLAGQDVITFKELVETIANEIKCHKVIVPVPIILCNIAAKIFERALANPPFTSEHVRSLSEDTQMDISRLIKDSNYKPIKIELGIKKLVEELRTEGAVDVMKHKRKSMHSRKSPVIIRQISLTRKLLKGLHSDNFLEIGCGDGFFLCKLDEWGYKGKGVDFSSSAIEKSINATKGLSNIAVEKIDFSNLEEHNKYDLILSMFVLEHIKDDIRALKKMGDLLKAGGYLILGLPARMKYYGIHDRNAGHYRRYERDEFIRKLKDCGFSCEKFWTFGFPIAYIMILMYDLLLKIKNIEVKNEMTERTKDSGIANTFPPRYEFLTKCYVILNMLMPLDRLFLNTNYGTHYIILAQKEENHKT